MHAVCSLLGLLEKNVQMPHGQKSGCMDACTKTASILLSYVMGKIEAAPLPTTSQSLVCSCHHLAGLLLAYVLQLLYYESCVLAQAKQQHARW